MDQYVFIINKYRKDKKKYDSYKSYGCKIIPDGQCFPVREMKFFCSECKSVVRAKCCHLISTEYFYTRPVPNERSGAELS